MTRPAYLCGGFLALVAVGYHGARLSGLLGSHSKPARLALPLAELPREANGWVGEDVPLSDEIIRVAGADAHLNRHYKHPGGNGVSLYIAFYGSVKDRIPHGPTVCYPYQGWHEEHNEMITLPSTVPAFSELQVRKLLYEKGGTRVAVLYWYAASGKQQVDPASQKVHAALRELIGHGGAYVFQVMVTAPVAASPEAPFATLERFLTQTFPAIAQHFPQ
jgi:EpsI family protein